MAKVIFYTKLLWLISTQKRNYRKQRYTRLLLSGQGGVRAYYDLLQMAQELLAKTLKDNQVVIERMQGGKDTEVHEYFMKHLEDEAILIKLTQQDIAALRRIDPSLPKEDATPVTKEIDLICTYTSYSRGHLPSSCAFADGVVLKTAVVDNIDNILQMLNTLNLHTACSLLMELKATVKRDLESVNKTVDKILSDSQQRRWFLESTRTFFHLYGILWEALADNFYTGNTH